MCMKMMGIGFTMQGLTRAYKNIGSADWGGDSRDQTYIDEACTCVWRWWGVYLGCWQGHRKILGLLIRRRFQGPSLYIHWVLTRSGRRGQLLKKVQPTNTSPCKVWQGTLQGIQSTEVTRRVTACLLGTISNHLLEEVSFEHIRLFMLLLVCQGKQNIAPLACYKYDWLHKKLYGRWWVGVGGQVPFIVLHPSLSSWGFFPIPGWQIHMIVGKT